MFTQLLHYVQVAINKGETLPPFLAIIDTEKAALMKSADVLPFLAKKPFNGANLPASIRKRRWMQFLRTLVRILCHLKYPRTKRSLLAR